MNDHSGDAMKPQYPDIQLYIDGQWTAGGGPASRQVTSPVDGRVLATFAGASAGDVARALDAARRGFGQWRDTAPIRRGEILSRAAALLRERADAIAGLAALELGQPLAEAKSYALRGADMIEWDAAEGRRVYGRIIPSEPGTRVMATREPLGVVAAFTPWNGPVFTPCRKIGSAVAAGCALVMKGAEEAPASTAAVVQCFIDAGVPPGVINLLYGDPEAISTQLIASPIVRGVSFTGSIAVGKHLAAKAAAVIKPCIMELGGHAPVIVCADADVEDAAKKLAFVKYRNAGQACLCPSRFWIAEGVYPRFVAAFLAEVAKLRIGDPFDSAVTLGPVASQRRLAAVTALIDDALAAGATLLAGGGRYGEQGCFVAPTVLGEVPAHARVMGEEPFGPIAALNPFTDLDAVIDAANSLPYGLAAYVFTRSSATAERLSRGLEVGTVGINHLTVSTSGVPFGGVKDSGYGREGGVEGVEGYTLVKTVSQLFVPD